MSSEADAKAEGENTGVFASAFCKSLTYYFELALDQFRRKEFLEAVKAAGGADTQAVCSPRDESSGYHVHTSWRERKDGAFALRVQFIGKGRAVLPNEGEPFAETFMPWLSTFFEKDEPQEAHIHAEFLYPATKRRSRFMLLPLKTKLGPAGVDVEIDGLSFSISPGLRGIERLSITQLTDDLSVYLIGDRITNLSTFDPADEIKSLAETSALLIEEAQQ